MAKKKNYYSDRYEDDDIYEDDEYDIYGYPKKKNTTSTFGSGYNYPRKTYNNNNYNNSRQNNGWSNWGSWSNYSTYDSRDSEDASLVVENPEGYLTPTKKEMVYKNVISNIEQGYGKTKYNSYAHSAYDIQEDSSKFIKNISRFFYHDMMEEPHYWGSIPEDNPERIKYEQIIDKIKDIRIPYSSPLEKAIFFHNKIFKGKEPAEKFGEVIMGDKLTTVLDQMKVDEDALNDKELKDTVDDIMKPGGLLGGDPFSNTYSGGKKIDMEKYDAYDLIDKISLIKNWGESFKISKEITKEIVHNSDRKEYLPMTSIEQIIHMDLYNILFPDFQYKLTTQSLHVNLPIKQEERKQKIIMLIDDSGCPVVVSNS